MRTDVAQPFDFHASYVKAIHDYVDANAVMNQHVLDRTAATPGQLQRLEDARVILLAVRRIYLATSRVH
jgi:hypothetical protein